MSCDGTTWRDICFANTLIKWATAGTVAHVYVQCALMLTNSVGGRFRMKSTSNIHGVTKVTFHLPPTATHLLGEWTLPSHALLLISSDAPDEVERR